MYTLRLLRAHTSVGVGDTHTKDLGLVKDLDTLLAAHIVRNLGGERVVVHEKEIHIRRVRDHKAAVAVGHNVAGLLVRTVANLGHRSLALEATAHGIVDTAGLTPRRLDAVEAVRLEARELLGALLDDRDSGSRHLG